MSFSEIVKMTTDNGVLEFGVAGNNNYIIFEQIINGKPCNIISKKYDKCEFRLNTNTFSDYLVDDGGFAQYKVIMSLKNYIRVNKHINLK